MKFITGLMTGVALGAAGAVYYSIRSGKDLRATYEDVRSEIDARNYEALGARIERGFADIQAELEQRLNQVRAGATAGLEDAESAASDATDEISDNAASVADDASDALDTVQDVVADGAHDVADAAGDAAESADRWSTDRA